MSRSNNGLVRLSADITCGSDWEKKIHKREIMKKLENTASKVCVVCSLCALTGVYAGKKEVLPVTGHSSLTCMSVYFNSIF